MQVWKVNDNSFYTGDSYFVDIPSEDEIITPLSVGYVKPKWSGSKWIEGATEQEIQEWKDSQVNKTEPSFEELQLEYNIDLDYRLSFIEMGLI